MSETKQRKTNKTLLAAVSLIIGIVLFFLIGEGIARVYYAVYPELQAPPPYDYRVIDKKLGWVNKVNYNYQGQMADQKGNNYPIHITTNEFGFRAFGDPAVKDKQKIFFIGDSYTHSVEVSEDKTFYKLLQDSIDFECFAFGAAGYGNLQEFLLMEQYIDQIDPDLVVWQLCTNDFIDNYWKLEMTSNYRVEKRRPYLTLEGDIIYKTPAPFYKRAKPYSNLIYLIGSRLGSLLGWEDPARKFTEKRIAEEGRAFEAFDHSVKLTDLVIRRFKEKLAGKAELLVFVSDFYQPQYEIMKELCKKNKVPFVDGIPQAIQAAAKQGLVVRAHDGFHWSEKGHEVVARELLEAIKGM